MKDIVEEYCGAKNRIWIISARTATFEINFRFLSFSYLKVKNISWLVSVVCITGPFLSP